MSETSTPVADAGGEVASSTADAAPVTSTEAPAAAKLPPPAAAAPAAPAKHKVKIHGKEREASLDELIVMAQKGEAADQRFQEAARKEREWQEKLGRLEKDPWNAAKDLTGKDLRAQLIQELMAEFDADQLKANDPRGYEVQQAKKELEAERARRAELEQREQSRTEQSQRAQVEQETFAQYSEALDKSGMPRSEELIIEAIDLELAALQQGRQLTADEIALGLKNLHSGRATKAIESEYGRLKGLQGEDLLKALPSDVVDSLQKALLGKARAKLGRPATSAPVVSEKPQAASAANKPQSASSVFRKLMLE